MEFGESKREPYLSIVVPVYGSEDCLEALVAAIDEHMGAANLAYEVILVNDFSPDRSWRVIETICGSNPNVIGIDLRKNFGQDNAILTGLSLVVPSISIPGIITGIIALVAGVFILIGR